MGSDFSRKCEVESRRALWIVALVLASVLVVQFFDIPHKGRVMSLFPLGSSHFSPSDDGVVNGSLPTRENIVPDLKHTDAEDSEIIPSPAPNEAGDGNLAYVSPSIGVVAAATSGGISRIPTNLSVAPAPCEASDAGIAASPTASPRKNDENGTPRNGSNGALNGPVAASNSPPPPTPIKQPKSHDVATISDMNDMLLQSRASSFSETPLWSSAADQELLDARFQIEHAPIITRDPALYAPIYRNLTTFIKSYEIMEQKLKVYVYKDGERPVFHNPRLRGIYASEGWFMKHMEASSQFGTRNPEEAHLFYLPFSSQLIVDYVYVKDSRSFDDINKFLKNYVETIKGRHPFWNRTDGADHFLVGCHDWATYETKRLMSNCIRALCNSDIKEGFKIGKDVALPETHIRSPQNPMRVTGGRPASERTTLAFFAGKMHGNVRSILLKHWEGKDPDMQISGPIRKGYMWYMQNSKYCVCAKGYEVNSPRVVEAILYGCVPVIVSDNFVPPFFEVLNWEKFAVFVLERDIPNLKSILLSISETRYSVMHHRVKRVRRHFVWHNEPQKYDIFHMILHSVWYNRVFRMSDDLTGRDP